MRLGPTHQVPTPENLRRLRDNSGSIDHSGPEEGWQDSGSQSWTLRCRQKVEVAVPSTQKEVARNEEVFQVGSFQIFLRRSFIFCTQ